MGGERITRQSIKKAKFPWRHPRVSLHHCAEQWKCFSAPLFFISPPLSLSVSSCLLLWSSRCVRLCFSSGTADVSTTTPYTRCWGRSLRTSHRSKICLSLKEKKGGKNHCFCQVEPIKYSAVSWTDVIESKLTAASISYRLSQHLMICRD